MSNVLGQVAEKIGILVQGGTVNIDQVHLDGDSQSHRPRNEKLLIKQVINEVDSRLKQSLHDHFINLNKTSQPELVSRSDWQDTIKFTLKEGLEISSNATILEVFDQPEIGGRLLILGDPGSGKTTTQLKLAKALLEEHVFNDQAYPIPVLFNLASWTPKQTITDWLLVELKSNYGVRKDIGSQWLKEQVLLPMLDGLDELKVSDQKDCVKALNRFFQSKQDEQEPIHVVVCCRSEEYGLLDTQLHLNAAIQLSTLTPEQVKTYLTKVEQTQLWSLISEDPELLRLMQIPLMLSITLLAYQDMSTEEWAALKNTQNRQQILWDIYIRRLLNPSLKSHAYKKQSPPLPQQTRRWLTWLAQQLERNAQTEFLIEGLQPGHLSRRSSIKAYFLTVSLLLGFTFAILITVVYKQLVSGLFVGLYVGIGSYLIQGTVAKAPTKRVGLSIVYSICVLLIGNSVRGGWESGAFLAGGLDSLAAGMIVGVGNWSTDTIHPFDSLHWNWRAGLRYGLLFGLLFTLIGTLGGNIISASDVVSLGGRVISSVILGIYIGIVAGFLGFGLGGLQGKTLEDKTIPNQAIRKSMMTAIIIGLISANIIGVWKVFIGHPLGIDWIAGLMVGLFGGGGMACLQHLILRIVLYRQDRMPWNYARFLNYGTERLFLQRVGGRYRFIHKFLQQHFAAMSSEQR